MGELWLVRHGETAWSLSGQHTGRTDIQLLARRLMKMTFALVLTSPLARARETCQLAGQAASAAVDPDLMEWDYGVYEGRTSADIRKEVPGWTIWSGGVRGGESADQVGERVDRVIARATAADGDAALFAHGHVLRILAARWLGFAASAGRYLALDTASLSKLGLEREQRVIRAWNESYDLLEVP
jgi:broad specificity phosphatase PhoE